MTTFTALAYGIVRFDEQAQARTLIGVGAGVVNVDEMSWDERLLVTSNTCAGMPHLADISPRPTSSASTHADDGTVTQWLGDSISLINLTSLDQHSAN